MSKESVIPLGWSGVVFVSTSRRDARACEPLNTQYLPRQHGPLLPSLVANILRSGATAHAYSWDFDKSLAKRMLRCCCGQLENTPAAPAEKLERCGVCMILHFGQKVPPSATLMCFHCSSLRPRGCTQRRLAPARRIQQPALLCVSPIF